MSAGGFRTGTVVLRGGTAIDTSGSRSTDVLFRVDDGRILAVGPGLEGDHTLDVSGCVIAPGLVDIHVHLRQPGRDEAETIESGTKSAVLGGFTAVVAMPNTSPTIDSPAMVREIQRLSESAYCAVHPSAAITVGRQGEALSPMAALVRLGVRIFTDDGDGVQNARVMRNALEYASSLDHLVAGSRSGGASGLNDRRGAASSDSGTRGEESDRVSGLGGVVLAQHCEVNELSAGGHMHEGEWSSRLGLQGQPAEAEELMVMRDVALVRLTGARMHFLHLSTAGSVEIVRAAKRSGLPVTAETTPHHFTLTDASCANYDTVFKVHPPLRTEADVAAIKAGLADGTIDAIATDHAPHTTADKNKPFDEAPPGMLGLETALALALTELDLPIEKILALMSWQPAAIAGINDSQGGPIASGAPANLCVIDPDTRWKVAGASMASRSSNTPFEGRVLRGRTRHTVVAGKVVVMDGEIQPGWVV